MHPDFFQSTKSQGRFFTISTQIEHLQEAMPFEKIEVSMYLERLQEDVCQFYFDYYSINSKKGRRKLAYGSQIVVWLNQDIVATNPIKNINFPSILIDKLKRIIQSKQ